MAMNAPDALNIPSSLSLGFFFSLAMLCRFVLFVFCLFVSSFNAKYLLLSRLGKIASF
jgi:hypothetical protein